MNNNINNGIPFQPQPPQQQGARLYKGRYYSDSQLEPLSPWAYFGYMILFSLPLLGFIFLIIFSVDDSNINRRNFARSYWCTLVLIVVLLIIFAVIGLSIGGILTGFTRYMY